jgi:hypothetical protein
VFRKRVLHHVESVKELFLVRFLLSTVSLLSGRPIVFSISYFMLKSNCRPMKPQRMNGS